MNKVDLQELVVQHENDLYDKLCDALVDRLRNRAKKGYEFEVISAGDYFRGDDSSAYPLSYYERFIESQSDELNIHRWKFLWWNLPYWTITWKVEE